MNNLREFIRKFHVRPVSPQDKYDVAILLRDSEGQQLPVIACVIEEGEFYDLEKDWIQALPERDTIQRAGCYWVEVNGKLIRQGIILTNIVSLTGVLIEPQIVGAT